MAKELSPEERLLGLIKGRQKGQDEPVGAPKEPVQEAEKIFRPAQHSAVDESERRFRPRPGTLNSSPSLNYNYIFVAIFFAVCVTAAIIIFSASGKDKEELKNIQTLVSSLSDKENKGKATPAAAIGNDAKTENAQPPSGSFEDYKAVLERKNIFATGTSSDNRANGPQEGPAISELVKDLRLVGIVPGDEPQAVIEDKKNSQTLFLKVGERIGDLEIKEISNGKVVLSYNNETATLSL